jgi:hypothetical protein
MWNDTRRCSRVLANDSCAERPSAPLLHLAALALLAPILLELTGCQEGATPIADLLEDPQRFEGQYVVLSGEVAGPLELPAAVLSFYTLRDETGRIFVHTDDSLPEDGSWVDICGEVKVDLTIAGRSFAVYLEEARRSEIDEFWIDARKRVFRAFDAVRRTASRNRRNLPF